MTNRTNMTNLEALAAKLYCVWTAASCPIPEDIDGLIKQIGKEVALIPYKPEQPKQDGLSIDVTETIEVDVSDLLFIKEAIEEAIMTPQDQLLPESVEDSLIALKRILKGSKG